MWDIHSPRVPDAAEIDRLLTAAIAALGADRLWVNPDCGLKTRAWPEVEASLAELVAAAVRARADLTPGSGCGRRVTGSPSGGPGSSLGWVSCPARRRALGAPGIGSRPEQGNVVRIHTVPQLCASMTPSQTACCLE